MKNRIMAKMMNATTPVMSGDVTQLTKMFFVSFQFTESNPLAAIEKPMIHPMIYTK
jgi:hypothetical protein